MIHKKPVYNEVEGYQNMYRVMHGTALLHTCAQSRTVARASFKHELPTTSSTNLYFDDNAVIYIENIASEMTSEFGNAIAGGYRLQESFDDIKCLAVRVPGSGLNKSIEDILAAFRNLQLLVIVRPRTTLYEAIQKAYEWQVEKFCQEFRARREDIRLEVAFCEKYN